VSILDASPEKETFDGDAGRFRLGVEALRLALAYEYNPYFSLSIARVGADFRDQRRATRCRY
jgi:hypothetical protein